MPEGHTIHRAARDHEEALGGQLVKVSSPQGRFDVAALVDPNGCARLRGVEAHGKHLFYFFGHGRGRSRIVHVHLGLFGKFYRRRTPAPPPRATTRLRLEGEKTTLDLVGPTASDIVTSKQVRAITDRLGPDPLRKDADPATFFARVARTRTPIGALLLDQSVISGVGNVYRAEVLHLVGVHPETPGNAIPLERVRAMWRLASRLLRRGVEEKRIVTTDIHRRGERTHVYGRKVCASCKGDVLTYTLRARRVHYCRTCQPLL